MRTRRLAGLAGLIGAVAIGAACGACAAPQPPTPSAEPSPSPDVASGGIAFTRGGDLWLSFDGDEEPLLVAESVAVRQIFVGNTRWLHWSPDGSTLAISGNGPALTGSDVQLLRWDSLNLRGLPSDEGHRWPWAWTPDSREIISTTLTSGPPGLIATDVASGESRRLSADDQCQVTYSPDGQWVAATTHDGELVVAAASDFEWRVIARHSGYGCAPFTGWDGPSWSPDSARLAFVSGVNGEPGGAPPFLETPERTTISVIGRDGSDPVVMTDDADVWAHPVWSPTDDWIAYRAHDGLRIDRPDGSESRLVYAGKVDRGRMAWTSDGNRLDFAVPFTTPYGLAAVWSYSLERDEARELAQLGLVHEFARRP